jgi:hypothetical protein
MVDDLSTFGGADALINNAGIVTVQGLRTERGRPARRISTLRDRMLHWLDDQETQGASPFDWSEFVAGPDADYYGSAFGDAEVEREANYLEERGLITAMSIEQKPSGTIGPRLTTAGRDHLLVEQHEGDVVSSKGFSINHQAIAAMTHELQRSFEKNPIRVPVELDDQGAVRAIGSTVHNYNGAFINGNLSGGAVLAWGNANVFQKSPRIRKSPQATRTSPTPSSPC